MTSTRRLAAELGFYLGTTVVLSASPVLVNALVAQVVSAIPGDLASLLGDGDLFVLSAVLAADAIARLVRTSIPVAEDGFSELRQKIQHGTIQVSDVDVVEQRNTFLLRQSQTIQFLATIVAVILLLFTISLYVVVANAALLEYEISDGVVNLSLLLYVLCIAVGVISKSLSLD